MSLLKEFKDFALRGNVLDMAIGIIIGASFGKVVSSLVNDILMPPLGLLLDGVDFTDLFINLSDRPAGSLEAARIAGIPTINYGVFVNTVIDLAIVAFAVFLVVKQANRLKKAPPPVPPSTRECPYCVAAIPVRAKRCPQCTSDLAAA